MPKYKITYRVSGGPLREDIIQAKSLEEATKRAEKDYHSGRTDWDSVYDLSIKPEPYVPPPKKEKK